MGKSDRLDDTELSAAQDALPVFAEAVWLLWSGNPPPAGDGGNGEGGGRDAQCASCPRAVGTTAVCAFSENSVVSGAASRQTQSRLPGPQVGRA